jgi:hypothetical protein
MSNNELLAAYNRARQAYEAAKAGNGYRPEAFVAFLVAERALAWRLGPEVYWRSYAGEGDGPTP